MRVIRNVISSLFLLFPQNIFPHPHYILVLATLAQNKFLFVRFSSKKSACICFPSEEILDYNLIIICTTQKINIIHTKKPKEALYIINQIKENSEYDYLSMKSFELIPWTCPESPEDENVSSDILIIWLSMKPLTSMKQQSCENSWG